MNLDDAAMRAGTEPTVLARGTVSIDIEACKGCDLCIDACPPRVLEMTTHQFNQRGYRYPQLLAGCTGCRACAQICPDFVFQVYKFAEPQRIPVPAPPTGSTAGGAQTQRTRADGEGGS